MRKIKIYLKIKKIHSIKIGIKIQNFNKHYFSLIEEKK